MINNSDPPSAPTMRTVYIRPNYTANDVAPAATDPAPSKVANDGVINLVNRPNAPSGAMESLAKSAGAAEMTQSIDTFARQIAKAILAEPMQAILSQRAPEAAAVTGLLGNRFGG